MSFKYPALAALLLAGTSAPAFAQAAGSANDPSETPQSPAEDAAQQAATDPTLEPADGNAIVVTAQRREQTLQDVSASVVAVGADRLANSQVNSLQDLQTVVPAPTPRPPATRPASRCTSMAPLSPAPKRS